MQIEGKRQVGETGGRDKLRYLSYWGKTGLNISTFRELQKVGTNRNQAWNWLKACLWASVMGRELTRMIAMGASQLTRVGPVRVAGSLAPADLRLHRAALSVLVQGPHVALGQRCKTGELQWVKTVSPLHQDGCQMHTALGPPRSTDPGVAE